MHTNVKHPNCAGELSLEDDCDAFLSVMISVTGMTCENCARTVERALSEVSGVTSSTVDWELCAAVVNGSASPAEMIATIERAGYKASLPPV